MPWTQQSASLNTVMYGTVLVLLLGEMGHVSWGNGAAPCILFFQPCSSVTDESGLASTLPLLNTLAALPLNPKWGK